MKLVSFRIKNFKGIKDTTIDLKGTKGSIYTLVGLNESGKTTLLEAINNFRHDVDGIHAIAQKTISAEPIEALVPKKLKDNFNDFITVAAKVRMKNSEIEELADLCKSEYDFQIDVNNFPQEFSVIRCHRFKQSAHKESVTLWDIHPAIKKKKRARKFVELDGSDLEWKIIVREVGKLFPRIVYFPTFLFDFPERILVSDGESEFEGNEYYKRMIEDSLASLDDPLDLKTHIVDRITNREPEIPFATWFAPWMQSDERERVNAVLAKLSQKISTEIFGRWEEVLGSELGQKEIVIEHMVEGSESGERSIYLEFKVKDGVSTFKVSERSLGFRWFFCFLLFTRFFRGSESGESIFLFDEPASNLHSKAQSKLLDSLQVIADGKNDVIYSTHSHHLINPLWLETTFIITNGKPIGDDSLETNFVVDDTDIHAQFYKTFVGENAEKSHYFQPILDRLQVSPSLLEATREGVITEGKSDFYILNWYKKYFAGNCKLDFIPVSGATGAGAVISLYLGIALRFVVLLDSDTAGNNAKKRYLETLPVVEESVVQINDVFKPQNMKIIEDLISQNLKNVIKCKYSARRVTKKLILRAFSECLSGTNFLPEDKETLHNLSMLVEHLQNSLELQ